MAGNFGSHYIWWYRQKLPFKKVDGLKFDSTQFFDAILNKFDGFNFDCSTANFTTIPSYTLRSIQKSLYSLVTVYGYV